MMTLSLPCLLGGGSFSTVLVLAFLVTVSTMLVRASAVRVGPVSAFTPSYSASTSAFAFQIVGTLVVLLDFPPLLSILMAGISLATYTPSFPAPVCFGTREDTVELCCLMFVFGSCSAID